MVMALQKALVLLAVCAAASSVLATPWPKDLLESVEDALSGRELEQAEFTEGERPNGNTAPLSCPMRYIAYAYAKEILQRPGIEHVYDGLNLGECNTSRPHVHEGKTREREERNEARSTADTAFFVSAKDGDDSNPGTEEKPFRTVHAAQAAIRKLQRPACGSTMDRNGVNAGAMATVHLREGVYFLGETLELTEQDSCTEWTNYQSEKAVLSGGFALDNLSWEKTTINNVTVYQVRVKVDDPQGFDQLFVNGVRQIRARYPNGDPTIPGDGMTNAAGGIPHGTPPSTGQGCVRNVQVLSKADNTTLSTGCAYPQTDTTQRVVQVPEIFRRPTYQDFQGYHGGSINRFDTTYNWPFWNTNSPTGLVFDKNHFSTKKWSKPSTGVLHAYHSNMWGGWMWSIRSINYDNDSILFERGGFQEARGGGMRNNGFYVENIFEELDNKREWFYDAGSEMLYYVPENNSALLSEMEVVGTRLKTLVSIKGNSSGSGVVARNITISGVTITHSGLTFLEDYEVPSGGDWSIHRGAAVFIQDAEYVAVTDCSFDQPGGNGLMLSNYAAFSQVARNDFSFCGDSAICSLGSTQLMFSEGPHYPIENVIEENHIRDVGVFGKQTSAYFKAITMGNIVRSNIMYNGPRAGVNFNDGFIGGEVLQGNLIFNFVRETGDHGQFNSWDRQPFLYKDKTGSSWKLTPEPHQLRGNLCFNTNFRGTTHSGYCFDLDDGSSQYNITGNVMVYGGVKVRDGIERHISGNLFVYSHSAVDWQIAGFNSSLYQGNTLVSDTGNAYNCVGAAFLVRRHKTAFRQSRTRLLLRTTSRHRSPPTAARATNEQARLSLHGRRKVTIKAQRLCPT